MKRTTLALLLLVTMAAACGSSDDANSAAKRKPYVDAVMASNSVSKPKKVSAATADVVRRCIADSAIKNVSVPALVKHGLKPADLADKAGNSSKFGEKLTVAEAGQFVDGLAHVSCYTVDSASAADKDALKKRACVITGEIKIKGFRELIIEFVRNKDLGTKVNSMRDEINKVSKACGVPQG